MSDNKKLLPCPFCGWEATVIETKCELTGYKGFHISHLCRLIKPMETYTWDTKQEAIDAWNRRTTNA